jgi:SiaC family regulatory phosphoprotein
MSLTIEESFDTPRIYLEKGLIKIEGRLMPENILIFFKPVDKWIDKYLKKPADITKIDLHLSYLNSCSSKHISDMLKRFNDKFLEGFEMKVSWTYEDNDDSALETGKDLQSLVDMPFEYKKIESQSKERKRIKVKNKLTGKTGEISLRYWETIKRNGHERDFELLENS